MSVSPTGRISTLCFALSSIDTPRTLRSMQNTLRCTHQDSALVSAMLRCSIRRASPSGTLLLSGPDAPFDAQEEITDVPFLIVGEVHLLEPVLPQASLELDEVGLVLIEHRDTLAERALERFPRLVRWSHLQRYVLGQRRTIRHV